MRIVFMGTPDFAVYGLRALYEKGHEICAVYTKPDMPGNRGMKLILPPVKEYALENGLPVMQPLGFKDEDTLSTLESLAPELIVVVAYVKILPQRVLDLPKYGCINVHGSLLPKYRGAAPIQRAVLNGEAETGVTTMYLSAGMDEGDIIDMKKTEIGPFETSGQLYERLAILGAELLLETVEKIENGTAPRIPQDNGQATYAPMLTKELSPIDWNKTAGGILNQVRGLNPWPVATAELNGTIFKIFEIGLTGKKTDLTPGSIVGAGELGLEVSCGGGEVVVITKLQAPGKKQMAATDYLRGHPLGGS